MTQAQVAGQGARHVLLAEDDPLLALTVTDFLQEEGFVVTPASDGVAALSLAKGLTFDILLTDLRMPGLDGTALIRALRATRPDLPVVIMSGDAPPGWKDRLGETGDARRVFLITKPMRLMHLRDTLVEALVEPATANV